MTLNTLLEKKDYETSPLNNLTYGDSGDSMTKQKLKRGRPVCVCGHFKSLHYSWSSDRFKDHPQNGCHKEGGISGTAYICPCKKFKRKP